MRRAETTRSICNLCTKYSCWPTDSGDPFSVHKLHKSDNDDNDQASNDYKWNRNDMWLDLKIKYVANEKHKWSMTARINSVKVKWKIIRSI